MTGPDGEPQDKKSTELPAEKAEGNGESEPKNSDESSADKKPESLDLDAGIAKSDAAVKTESSAEQPDGADPTEKPEENEAKSWTDPAGNLATDKDKPVSEDTKPDVSEAEKQDASSLKLTQHHVSHLLSDVLSDEDSSPPAIVKGLRFPMIFDCLLGIGLLVAVGGFSAGLFQMYIIHGASQCISEERYKAAITILKGAPMPQVFARPGSDTEDLLSKARYLYATSKLKDDKKSQADVDGALKELGEIKPGSRYFALAQQIIIQNTAPAPIMLQGGAETIETAPVEAPKQSLLEKTLKEGEQN